MSCGHWRGLSHGPLPSGLSGGRRGRDKALGGAVVQKVWKQTDVANGVDRAGRESKITDWLAGTQYLAYFTPPCLSAPGPYPAANNWEHSFLQRTELQELRQQVSQYDNLLRQPQPMRQSQPMPTGRRLSTNTLHGALATPGNMTMVKTRALGKR